MHARAIFVRGLFAVSRLYSRFVRAIARFQRKFSVNHAKSAYFQMCIRDRDYTEGEGWHDARIVPYGPFELDPATVVFHYAQEIFEGMKAYLSLIHISDRAETVQPWLTKQKSHEIFRLQLPR